MQQTEKETAGIAITAIVAAILSIQQSIESNQKTEKALKLTEKTLKLTETEQQIRDIEKRLELFYYLISNYFRIAQQRTLKTGLADSVLSCFCVFMLWTLNF